MISEKDVYITAEVFTTKYLGKEDLAVKLLNLLLRNNTPYVPEKWGADGRPRYGIDLNDFSPIIKEWLAPNISDKYFKEVGQENELLDLITDICLATDAVYGFIVHKTRESRQSPILTPAERLPGIYWANFFGQPYIDFFGREKLLATPCHEVREINESLILLLTAESPFQPEMLENDDIPDLIKGYLNQNAFAGPRFPDEPCEVPKFDFSDLRPKTETLDETPDQNGKYFA